MISVNLHIGDDFPLGAGEGIADGYRRDTGVGSDDGTKAIVLPTLGSYITHRST